jgi:excinuclease UvrABC ATPase subunit
MVSDNRPFYPLGGVKDGETVAEGTPEQVAKEAATRASISRRC